MGLSCPTVGQRGPINPDITPQRDEHQGENLQAQTLENTEASDSAWDIRHGCPQKTLSVHRLVKT